MSTRKDGTSSRADFRYDEDRNIYTCPAGKTLKTTGRIHDGKTILYRAIKADCQQCPLKQRCCPKAPECKVPRDVNEAARDVARTLVGTPSFERLWGDRKKVEMWFAHLKTHHRFDRLRLRGLSGARDEFHLAAIVQNLKTMAMRLTRPPPQARAA